jgi:peptidoglycan/LPS O-acetylase OafA/YrhL
MWQSALIPLVLVGTILNPYWLVSRLLESTVFIWIGRISYGLYLWQQMFLVPLKSGLPLGILQLFPLNIFVVFGVAGASYAVLERPLMRLGHRLAMDTTRVASTAMSGGCLTAAGQPTE